MLIKQFNKQLFVKFVKIKSLCYFDHVFGKKLLTAYVFCLYYMPNWNKVLLMNPYYYCGRPAILSETVQKSKWIVMILGVNLEYHSKKLYPLINDQYTVRSDEAFRFAVGSFIENVWFVLVYKQTKANMLTLMLHETILII